MATIKAALPGVLYWRASPDTDPYVAEGSPVALGQTIALIEVMKTFNEVKANEAGVVTRLLVDDGAEVAVGEDIVEVQNT